MTIQPNKNTTKTMYWINYQCRNLFYLLILITLFSSCIVIHQSLFSLHTHFQPTIKKRVPNPFRLSKTQYYNKNFIQSPLLSRPSHSFSYLKHLIHKQKNLALLQSKFSTIPSSFTITNGISVNDDLEKHGYIHNNSIEDEICLGRLHGRVPYNAPRAKPMCLSVLRNSFLGTSGVALDPKTSTVYELAGGCCTNDWPLYINETITLTSSQLKTVKQYPNRIILVLAQHHGTTYHHVIHEVVSRYLSILPLLDAMPQIYIAIDDSDVAFKLLTLLGLNQNRIIRNVRFGKVDWKFGSVLLYPKTLFQHEHEGYFPKDKHAHATAGVLRGAVQRVVPKQPKIDDRKVLLVIERAISRYVSGCYQSRCVRNFAALYDSLKKSFEKEYRLQIYKATDEMHTAIQLFSIADVVVGVHGAGFQNLMFCKPGTTVVHIGWGIHYKYLADDFGLKYHLSKVPHMRLNDKNLKLNVGNIVKDVRKAIEDDRKR